MSKGEAAHGGAHRNRKKGTEAADTALSADASLPAHLDVPRLDYERLRLVFELSQDGIILIQKGGAFVQVNPAACDILGYTEEQLLGMTAFEVPAPSGLFTIEEQLARYPRTETVVGDLTFVRPDGQTRVIEFSARSLPDDLYMAFVRDVTERRESEAQLRLYSEHLEELVEQRAERIRELERHRASADKLAATGRIAARIAHEINNPLAGIKNSFLLVKGAVSPDYPYFRYVASIEKEINRITRIVAQMFDLYQPNQEIPQRFNLGEILEDVILMLEPLSRQRQATVSTRLPEFPVIVFQPEGLMRQVLYNIIANGIEASPPDATVRIHAAVIGDDISISVADRGPGITEEVAAHLFEPFFTTKTGRADEGIGLGLSVSRTLVDLMQGSLTYQSKVGEGTVFRVVVPQNVDMARPRA